MESSVSAVQLARLGGGRPFINVLLDAHCDANARIRLTPPDGSSSLLPLTFACHCSMEFCIQWLVEHRGAAPDVHDAIRAALWKLNSYPAPKTLRIVERFIALYKQDVLPYADRFPNAMQQLIPHHPLAAG